MNRGPRNPTEEFLAQHFADLRDDELIEIRCIKTDPRDVQISLFTNEDDAATFALAWNDRGYNAYYGVNPRSQHTQGAGDRGDVTRPIALFADLDATEYAGGLDEAAGIIQSAAIPPTVVIETGGGLQALWHLLPSSRDPDLLGLYEGLEARLVAHLPSDPSAKDLPRILRLPGTVNHKYPERPIARVVHHQPGLATTLEAVDGWLPATVRREERAHRSEDLPPLEVIASALQAVSAWDIPYLRWVAFLGALKDAYGDTALPLAVRWGQGKDGEVEAKWPSFKRQDGATVGSIIYEALQRGWQPPRDEPSVEDDAGHIAPKSRGRKGKGLFPENLKALFAEPIEPDEWVVEDLLIRDGVSLLAAKPKHGKSTLAFNIAVAVSEGRPVLGKKVIGGRVLYCTFEDIRRQSVKKFREMGADGEFLDLHFGAIEDENGRDPIGQLRLYCQAFRPILIVIDPIFKLMKFKGETEYADVSDKMQGLKSLAEEQKIHILCTHHSTKAITEDPQDSVLGTTALAGAYDNGLFLRKEPEGQRIFQTVVRYGTPWPPTVLQLDEATNIVSIAGTKLEVTARDVKERILQACIQEGTISQPDLIKTIGGARETVIHLANDLVKAGRLQKGASGKSGDPYTYTYVPWYNPSDPEPPTQGSFRMEDDDA